MALDANTVQCLLNTGPMPPGHVAARKPDEALTADDSRYVAGSGY
jgi:hypothetical protein